MLVLVSVVLVVLVVMPHSLNTCYTLHTTVFVAWFTQRASMGRKDTFRGPGAHVFANSTIKNHINFTNILMYTPYTF